MSPFARMNPSTAAMEYKALNPLYDMRAASIRSDTLSASRFLCTHGLSASMYLGVTITPRSVFSTLSVQEMRSNEFLE